METKILDFLEDGGKRLIEITSHIGKRIDYVMLTLEDLETEGKILKQKVNLKNVYFIKGNLLPF